MVMNLLMENSINCPYCGELITILVDGSIEIQQYIEDCQVCCRPIDLQISVASGSECQIVASSEND